MPNQFPKELEETPLCRKLRELHNEEGKGFKEYKDLLKDIKQPRAQKIIKDISLDEKRHQEQIKGVMEFIGCAPIKS